MHGDMQHTQDNTIVSLAIVRTILCVAKGLNYTKSSILHQLSDSKSKREGISIILVYLCKL